MKIEVSDTGDFKFQYVETVLPCLGDREVKDFLTKWDLYPYMKVHGFAYDRYFRPHEAKEFLEGLFGSPEFQTHFRAGSRGKSEQTFTGDIKNLEFEALSTTIMNMDFFDKLEKLGVTRPNGNIVGCFPNSVHGVEINDRLRELLLDEDSELFCELSEADRAETIVHLVTLLVLGGGMCQYEDAIAPYLALAKRLYKDLITVHRDAGGKIEATSLVYKVTAAEAGYFDLFPYPAARQNLCLVVVDPQRRSVKMLYAPFHEIY